MCKDLRGSFSLELRPANISVSSLWIVTALNESGSVNPAKSWVLPCSVIAVTTFFMTRPNAEIECLRDYQQFHGLGISASVYRLYPIMVRLDPI
ncbi:unannotated protein [freshwater metagenome]|uniref:Unannotated protein n=1 Tax=freshwater metagenome TaxID=449393 RepID=A0A6J7BZ73_9ZZZZ